MFSVLTEIASKRELEPGRASPRFGKYWFSAKAYVESSATCRKCQ